MKADELRALETERLHEQLNTYYQELFNLRFQKVTGKLTNTARAKTVRRDMARIRTILRERELEQEAV